MPSTSLLLTGLLIACPAVFAQTTSFGLIGGRAFTDAYNTAAYPTDYAGGGAFVFGSGPRGLIIGPTLEIRLPWRFAIEADALHRNLQRSSQFVSYVPGFPHNSPAYRTQTPWEFPVLAKYRFSILNLHPLLEAGPSFRPAGTGTDLSHVGITTGAGMEFRFSRLTISPQLRYTHWAPNGLSARLDQVEALMGLGWSSEVLRPNALGRKLLFGALVGIVPGDNFRPATGDFFVQTPESNTLIAGASVEVPLVKNLSLEVDGIYRPLHATDVSEGHSVRFATLTWEFPMLMKYRFKAPVAKPFVELGPSFRAIGNLEIAPPSHYGVAGGAGVDFSAGKMKISPALRYTRWAQDGSHDPNIGHSFANQVELLFGISF